MVLAIGLEPTSLAATDFKSVVYTNSTTRALLVEQFRKLAQAG